jgi:hypothetical protein
MAPARSLTALAAAACWSALLGTASATTLVGLSGAYPPALVHVSTVTGAVTFTGPPVPSELVTQQLAAYDRGRGILYALSFDINSQATVLFGLNATTGALTSRVLVPALVADPAPIGTGQGLCVEPASGRVVAVGQKTLTGAREVGYVDVATGAYTLVATLDSTLQAGLSSIASCSDSGTVLVTGVVGGGRAYDLILVDLASKKVTVVAEGFNDDRNVQAFAYDAADRAFVGLGLSPDQSLRTVEALSESTLAFSFRGNVTSGFAVMMGAIAAYDAQAKTTRGDTPAAPFSIVGVSAADATTVSVSSAPLVKPEPYALFVL